MGASVYERQLQRRTINELIPVESFDPVNQFFYTADGFIGFGFMSKPLSGADEAVTQRLNTLFTFDWPVDSVLQFLLLGTPDIGKNVEKIKDLHMTSNTALAASLDNRIDMLNKGTREAISMHAEALIRNFKSIMTVKIPIRQNKWLPGDDEIARLRDLRLSVEQTLSSVGLITAPLDAEAYLRVVGQVLHWGPNAGWRDKNAIYDPEVPINEQVAESDDMIECGQSGIWLGAKRLRILSPSRFPDNMSIFKMRRLIGDPMSGSRGLHAHFFISLNILLPDNSAEKSRLEAERNATDYQVFGAMMRINPKISHKKTSIDLLTDATNDGGRIVKACLSVGLFTDSLDQSESRLSEVLAYFSEQGWQMREDRYIALPMLINALPLCADVQAVKFLQRYRRLSSQDVVQFMPILADWSGTGTPQMTFVSRSGQVMAVDIFDSNTNYNTCIVAASGSGKSFLTNDIITSYISSGAKCWVIDIGRSYEKLCDAVGGDFIEFGHQSAIGLNPFKLITDYNEEADMLVGIITSMAFLEDKLSDLQHSRLRSILKNLWDAHGGNMTVDHVVHELLADADQRIQDMGHQLYSFTSAGEYGKYFIGENTVRFDNALTCLELEELKGKVHLQQVVLLILIYQIQQAMYLGNRGQRKILIIDEAWDLLSKGNIARFIETGYRRFRKYNGAAITVTQSLNDLHASPSGIAIAENSANMFLLYQKAETLESVKRQNRLALSEGAFDILRTVHTMTGQYSEIFFITSYGTGIGRLIVDKYTRLLYSTHPDDIGMINGRTAQGMSTDEAINDILNNPTGR